MSWQGQWAGHSAGRWFGYAPPAPPVVVPVAPLAAGFRLRPLPAARIAWLQARIGGSGDLAGRLDGPLAVRARRVREEEFLRRLH